MALQQNSNSRGQQTRRLRQQTLLGIRRKMPEKRCKSVPESSGVQQRAESVAGSPPHWRITSKWNTNSGSSALLTNMSNQSDDRAAKEAWRRDARPKNSIDLPQQIRADCARTAGNTIIFWLKKQPRRDETSRARKTATVTPSWAWACVSMEFFTLQFIHEQLATVSGGLSASQSLRVRGSCAPQDQRCNGGGNAAFFSCAFVNLWKLSRSG